MVLAAKTPVPIIAKKMTAKNRTIFRLNISQIITLRQHSQCALLRFVPQRVTSNVAKKVQAYAFPKNYISSRRAAAIT